MNNQWAYKTIKVITKGFLGGIVDIEEFEEELNRMGYEGWELVSTFDTSQGNGASREVVCVFKRRV